MWSHSPISPKVRWVGSSGRSRSSAVVSEDALQRGGIATQPGSQVGRLLREVTAARPLVEDVLRLAQHCAGATDVAEAVSGSKTRAAAAEVRF
jgi:hypothetical protein